MLNILNYKAILFGSIGTIVETSELQRRAFNQAFSEAGLKWKWTSVEYQKMLRNSGGLNRIVDFANQLGVNVDAIRLHNRKTEIFNNMMNEKNISLRPGVANLIGYAVNHDINLAFVTSTSEANIDAMFFALNNQIERSNFSFIGNDKIVSKSKPNSEIYLKALFELKLNAEDCIAIEDTEVSMRSAIDANISCIGFPGAYALQNDFSNAILVTDNLSKIGLTDFKK